MRVRDAEVVQWTSTKGTHSGSESVSFQGGYRDGGFTMKLYFRDIKHKIVSTWHFVPVMSSPCICGIQCSLSSHPSQCLEAQRSTTLVPVRRRWKSDVWEWCRKNLPETSQAGSWLLRSFSSGTLFVRTLSCFLPLQRCSCHFLPIRGLLTNRIREPGKHIEVMK